MKRYSQELVNQLDRKIARHIQIETERLSQVHERFVEVAEKRFGDEHTFLSEVKDELDRLGEKVKVN